MLISPTSFGFQKIVANLVGFQRSFKKFNSWRPKGCKLLYSPYIKYIRRDYFRSPFVNPWKVALLQISIKFYPEFGNAERPNFQVLLNRTPVVPNEYLFFDKHMCEVVHIFFPIFCSFRDCVTWRKRKCFRSVSSMIKRALRWQRVTQVSSSRRDKIFQIMFFLT